MTSQFLDKFEALTADDFDLVAHEGHFDSFLQALLGLAGARYAARATMVYQQLVGLAGCGASLAPTAPTGAAPATPSNAAARLLQSLVFQPTPTSLPPFPLPTNPPTQPPPTAPTSALDKSEALTARAGTVWTNTLLKLFLSSNLQKRLFAIKGFVDWCGQPVAPALYRSALCLHSDMTDLHVYLSSCTARLRKISLESNARAVCFGRSQRIDAYPDGSDIDDPSLAGQVQVLRENRNESFIHFINRCVPSLGVRECTYRPVTAAALPAARTGQAHERGGGVSWLRVEWPLRTQEVKVREQWKIFNAR